MKVREVMNPFKFGFFSFEVISHKLLRWLIPIFIVSFAFGSLFLTYQSIYAFQIVTLLGIIFLWLAQIGFLKSRNKITSPLFFIPYYFLMVNYYSLLGVLTGLAGNIQVTWSTPRVDAKQDSILNLKTTTILLIINVILITVFYDIWTLI
jgi:hypothetical protein